LSKEPLDDGKPLPDNELTLVLLVRKTPNIEFFIKRILKN